jgi:hypothetical protein
MYKYLLAFVLVSPLVGIYLVEGGEYAPSVGYYGYPNGASFAFFCYAATVAAAAWLTSGRRLRFPPPRYGGDLALADQQFLTFSKNLLWVNLGFLLIFLFAFNAISVLTASVGKGEFRANLGWFGAFPNLMTKFILPAFMAYAAALYLKTSKKGIVRLFLLGNFAVLFLIGASWGFKTTALLVILPSLVILYWRISIADMFMLSVLGLMTILASFFLFDVNFEAYGDVGSYLMRRFTVIQGDTAWFIWDKHISGQEFPNYWPTLLAAFGGKMLSSFGPARDDLYQWMLHNYDWMLTYLTDASLEQIAGGHSLTATPFAEGLVAGGVAGVAFFAVVGGLIVGRIYAFIQRSIWRGRDVQAAIGATYFCFYVFAWLNGGAVVQLFHISVWFALGVTILAMRFLRKFRVTFRSLRAADPSPAP